MATVVGNSFDSDNFTPFTFDASPLQKYLQRILKEVEDCRQENAALKAELEELKVAQRLDTLEQSLQEIADLNQKQGYSYLGTYQNDAEAGTNAVESTDGTAVGERASLDGQAGAAGASGQAQHGANVRDGQDGAAASAAMQQQRASNSGTSGAAGASGKDGAAGVRGSPGGLPHFGGGVDGVGGLAGTPPLGRHRGGGAVDPSWVVYEFTTLKDRMTQMERKAETLWHVQESEEELRGLLNRLKTDVDTLRSSTGELQGGAKAAAATTEKLESASAVAAAHIQDLQEKMVTVDAALARANEDKREVTAKLENNVNLIWDQIRHVESSLSQRLQLAETSQISTLQEVDEVKESAHEVMGRVEDVKRHIAALESKLESFNTQVAAALAPLHSSLGDVKIRLEDLSLKKQDTATAVSMDDVNAATSRAIDHADRRTDNVIKSLGAMEERVEELNDLKANKCDVVMTSDLEALLTAHAAELDRHLDALKEEILRVVSLKADKEEMAALDAKLGARISSLENAILKGLKAISDKVSVALAEKLDLERFNEFKVQVRAILADVEDRLKDWSPLARGLKAPLDAANGMGATSCLCCDSRVRSAKELQGMGFSSNDKVFTPEKLPLTGALFPSIQRNPELAASTNPKVAGRKKEVADMLSRSTNGISESMPGPTGQDLAGPTPRSNSSGAMAGPAVIDAAMFGPDGFTKPGRRSGGAKMDVETISGAIAQGRIPAPLSNKAPPSGGVRRGGGASPWETGSPRPTGLDLTIDATQQAAV